LPGLNVEAVPAGQTQASVRLPFSRGHSAAHMAFLSAKLIEGLSSRIDCIANKLGSLSTSSVTLIITSSDTAIDFARAPNIFGIPSSPCQYTPVGEVVVVPPVGHTGHTGHTVGAGHTGQSVGAGHTGQSVGAGHTGHTGQSVGAGHTGHTGQSVGAGHTGHTGQSVGAGHTGHTGHTGQSVGAGHTGHTGQDVVPDEQTGQSGHTVGEQTGHVVDRSEEQTGHVDMSEVHTGQAEGQASGQTGQSGHDVLGQAGQAGQAGHIVG